MKKAQFLAAARIFRKARSTSRANINSN